MENVVQEIEGRTVPALGDRNEGEVCDNDTLAAPTTSSGLINMRQRPQDTEPDIPEELYNVPKSRAMEEMPQWYRETLVETEPLIQAYDLTHDPLEVRESAQVEYY
ncbi:hypothetical protein TraAM80_07196 [Trypanosoma rangeli]|uniref:Uncharacterized protein n=1 Tax=Trypanosoma rangeli TaxID=5698 RepID=A0A422N6T2_TRYRA|nr:uncharacterized protein TraAM80_07196 [Trypanosoma rangeli]RNF01146.1 hypothetical protein TraAM80_07196 [Trypanosoma rangeli]|eukprot:RNF01146.1 hypothetical protein TraAM80_07196 [Trypanosoma rangeli]